jgi:hypothetical protein
MPLLRGEDETDMKRSRIGSLMLAALLAAACGDGEAPAPATNAAVDQTEAPAIGEVSAARAGLPPEQQEFWANLEEHCGNAYPGYAAIIREGDTRREGLYGGYEMVAHFRQCFEDELRVPGHIGEDRSRTWILTPVNGGLDLRHDHREPDGSSSENTMYGASTSDPGTPLRQEFTREGQSGYWVLEMVPGERFSYGNHDGDEWLVRFDVDIREPIDLPPPPWGYEETKPYPPVD